MSDVTSPDRTDTDGKSITGRAPRIEIIIPPVVSSQEAAKAEARKCMENLPQCLQEAQRKSNWAVWEKLPEQARTKSKLQEIVVVEMQKVRPLSEEWEQMRNALPRERIAAIESRSPATVRQLLEMKIYSRVNVDRMDAQSRQETLDRQVRMVDRWLELQDIVDGNPGMNERMERLKAVDVQNMLNNAEPVEDLLDKRSKRAEQFLEPSDIDKLLPVALSKVEMRRVEVMGSKLEEHIHTLAQSSLTIERKLAGKMEEQVNAMDPGVYYNMLLGKLPPYELRIAIAAESEGVTWELIKATYLTEADTRLILRGEALDKWKAAQTEWHRTLEARKPELDKEWTRLMDHFYDHRIKTYARLAQMPAEMRYHLLSVDVSPHHLLDQLKPNLQQVMAILHPDDLYPFLQQRVDKPMPSFGANAHWLHFQEIVHKLHERLETGKTQCVGTDFFTGLPLYPPTRYSFFALGTPGGGKTDNVVLINLLQHRSSGEALIVIDPKGDSVSFVKTLLNKDNLGELTGIAAGAVGMDHRIAIVGPGPEELGVNILWSIPTTRALTERVQQMERQIERMLSYESLLTDEALKASQSKLDALNHELTELRSDLTLLERKQHQMAVKVGAAWAKASIDMQDLKRMSNTSPAIRDMYLQTISAAMLHLRLTNSDLPALSELRFIRDEVGLQALKGSPSQFARDTYTSIQALPADQRAVLRSLLVASTSVLNDPIVQRFTNTNGVDIEAILRPEAGKNPWSVFVNMHLNLNDAQLLAPVYESMFETWHEVIKYAKIHSPKVHENNIFMVMDEAKNIATRSSNGGIHPNMGEIIDVLRSAGYRGLFSTQSPDPDILPPDLLGKATLLVVTPDDATARYVADKVGITTKQLDTQSTSSQNVVSHTQGRETPSFGYGYTTDEQSQIRNIIQETRGVTAQELPLIRWHNLVQLPRSLGIMIVPGNAPALYQPINPRKSPVIKALRRLEPVVLHEPVKDSQTPVDMAEQLKSEQPTAPMYSTSEKSGSSTSELRPELEIEQIEEIRDFFREQADEGNMQAQDLKEVEETLFVEIQALEVIRQRNIKERKQREAQG